MKKIPVSDQTRVTLFFSLALEDGSVVDSNFGAQPASFVPGDGNLLPGFESVLKGLCVGEKKHFLIPAIDAFGLRQDANLKRVPRERFGGDIELVPGLVVSFAAAEGGELPGVVHRLMGDIVEIDFNHPLAGHSIVFDVEIVGVDHVVCEQAGET